MIASLGLDHAPEDALVHRAAAHDRGHLMILGTTLLAGHVVGEVDQRGTCLERTVEDVRHPFR